MNATDQRVSRAAKRNADLVEAEIMRSRATHDAQIEYSETVAKLRDRYEGELAAAAARLRQAVHPAQRAYNGAVIAAERAS